MGIFKQLFDAASDAIADAKEAREADRRFVQENKGSEAICAFFVDLFEKGNSGYNWVKENRMGLYPIIHEMSVSLCYMQPGDGKSFSGMKPTDEEVVNYTFQEMYDWYGLEPGRGYARLSSKTQCKTLETMISNAVQDLPHIKYNIGFMVKMFQ